MKNYKNMSTGKLLEILVEAANDSKTLVHQNIISLQSVYPQGDQPKQEYFQKVNAVAADPSTIYKLGGDWEVYFDKLKGANTKTYSKNVLNNIEAIPAELLPDRNIANPQNYEKYITWLANADMLISFVNYLTPEKVQELQKLKASYELTLRGKLDKKYAFDFDKSFHSNILRYENYLENHGPLKFRISSGWDLPGGYRIVEIGVAGKHASPPDDIKHDLGLEGCDRGLSHCVGTLHVAPVLAGEEIIFSLRKDAQTPVATLSYSVLSKGFVECKGKGNSAPKKEYLLLIYDWLVQNFNKEQFYDLEHISNIVIEKDKQKNYDELREQDSFNTDDRMWIRDQIRSPYDADGALLILKFLLEDSTIAKLDKSGGRMFKTQFPLTEFIRGLWTVADDRVFLFLINNKEKLVELCNEKRDLSYYIDYALSGLAGQVISGNETVSGKLLQKYVLGNTKLFFDNLKPFFSEGSIHKFDNSVLQKLLETTNEQVLTSMKYQTSTNLSFGKISNLHGYELLGDDDLEGFYKLEPSKLKLFLDNLFDLQSKISANSEKDKNGYNISVDAAIAEMLKDLPSPDLLNYFYEKINTLNQLESFNDNLVAEEAEVMVPNIIKKWKGFILAETSFKKVIQSVQRAYEIFYSSRLKIIEILYEYIKTNNYSESGLNMKWEDEEALIEFLELALDLTQGYSDRPEVQSIKEFINKMIKEFGLSVNLSEHKLFRFNGRSFVRV
jgi:hypothetical protein